MDGFECITHVVGEEKYKHMEQILEPNQAVAHSSMLRGRMFFCPLSGKPSKSLDDGGNTNSANNDFLSSASENLYSYQMKITDGRL